jgi:hypothetical protein
MARKLKWQERSELKRALRAMEETGCFVEEKHCVRDIRNRNAKDLILSMGFLLGTSINIVYDHLLATVQR